MIAHERIAMTLFLFAFARFASEVPASEVPTSALPPELLDLRQPSDADIPWRLVLKIDAPGDLGCPLPDSTLWEARAILTSSKRRVAKNTQFCIYTLDNPQPEDEQSLRSFLAQRLVGVAYTLAADRLVVVPQGGQLSMAVQPLLQDQFASQAGAGHWIFDTGDVAPNLIVIDTASGLRPNPHLNTDSSPHGYSLIHQLRTMLCNEPFGDEASCVAHIGASLALPYRGYNPASETLSAPDYENGGFLGSMVTLAEAIERAVDAWEAATLSARGPLVLSLSIGWESKFGRSSEGDPTAAHPGAELVHHAILDARCRGALVIAAAGNRVDGPAYANAGPLLPAGWEGESFVSTEDCSGTGNASPVPSRKTADSYPLVYAAGGIDATQRILTNARPKSLPQRMAYGSHAWVESYTSTPTEILTGSSVSTAVVAGAAAAIWRFRPDLNADEVMDALYQSSPPLQDASGTTMLADVFLGAPFAPPEVHVIKVCSTVQLACQGPVGCLGSVACYQPPGRIINWMPFDNAAQRIAFPALSQMVESMPAECGPLSVFRLPGVDPSLDILCPSIQLNSLTATPWVGPQPTEDVCEACTQSCCANNAAAGTVNPLSKNLPSSGLLRVETQSLAGKTLSAPTITTNKGIFRLPESAMDCLLATAGCAISNLPDDGDGPVTLSFAVTDNGLPCGSSAPIAGPCWSTTSLVLRAQ